MRKRNLAMMISGVLFLALIASINGNCGGGSSSGSSHHTVQTMSVSGHTGTGYTSAYAPSHLPWFNKFCRLFSTSSAWAITGDLTVDKIIAIPYNGGKFDSCCIHNAKESDVVSGSFSLTLEKNCNWLLLLINTAALNPDDRFVAYAALNVNGTEGLLQLPATSATASNLDLGNLDRTTTDTAVSSNPITTTDFSMTTSQLLSLAKNDDMLKIVRNFFLNYDKTTGTYYNLIPEFSWHGQYSAIENNYQPVTNYVLSSYQLELTTNTTTLSVNNLCGNNTTKVQAKLVPPADVHTLSGIVYSPSVPISNAAATSANIDPDGMLRAHDFFAGGQSGQYVVLALGSCNLTGTIPEGYWTWYEDNIQKAKFDVAIAAPITATNKIKCFVPSIKVNTNPATGQIMSVNIKWYALNSSNLQYEEITDLGVLKYLMGTGGSVFFDKQGGNRYDNIRFTDTSTTIYPTYEWYYGNNGADASKRAAQIGVIFTSSGIGYYCGWSTQIQ